MKFRQYLLRFYYLRHFLPSDTVDCGTECVHFVLGRGGHLFTFSCEVGGCDR